MSPITIPISHSQEQEFHPNNFIESYINVWKGVVLNPAEFFTKMPLTEGYANPLIFLIVSSAIGGLLGSLISLGSITGLFFAPIGGIIGSFIAAGIIHLFAKLFTNGAKGGYQATWRVLSYSSALSVLTWIPIIGSIIGLYGIYIAIVGIEHVHGTDRTKAALTVLVPVVVFIFIFAILAATLGFAMLQLFGTIGG